MTQCDRPDERRLIVLGSTGSIGANTLEVVEHLNRTGAAAFDVVGLAAGSRGDVLCQQARHFNVEHVSIAGEQAAASLRSVQHVHAGIDGALRMIEAVAQPGDLVMAAMVGAAGLAPVLAAIERGCDIALANKETLVAAGDLVMPLACRKNVSLLPVDSEHSAVFQCLRSGRAIDEVQRVVLTASGGPFRTWSKQQLEAASVNEALNHPTWKMGPKITIDSASLMNKALEVIEAHWLFALPAEKIDVVVHPQSIVHSFVEFVDGSIIAQLGPPDMRTPIQYALTWPNRCPGNSRVMDWSNLRRMDFEPVDHERFGALRLAQRVIRAEGSAGAVFNAANEAAVQAFLDQQIPFSAITRLVGETMDEIAAVPVQNLDDVMAADAAARTCVKRRIMSADSATSRPGVASRA